MNYRLFSLFFEETQDYLRHYTTFINLGDNFNISESYANKIYYSILTILVQELHVP